MHLRLLIVGEMYENMSERGGRPNIDEVLMVKLLVLQQWHGLSDPELEKQVTDRISFRKFLAFPAVISRVFNASHVMVTTVRRVSVKMIFTAFGFNLYQLCTLKKQGAV